MQTFTLKWSQSCRGQYDYLLLWKDACLKQHIKFPRAHQSQFLHLRIALVEEIEWEITVSRSKGWYQLKLQKVLRSFMDFLFDEKIFKLSFCLLKFVLLFFVCEIRNFN